MKAESNVAAKNDVDPCQRFIQAHNNSRVVLVEVEVDSCVHIVNCRLFFWKLLILGEMKEEHKTKAQCFILIFSTRVQLPLSS